MRRQLIKKILKWLVIGVAALYLLMAAGLTTLNWWTPKGPHSAEALLNESKAPHQLILHAYGLQSLFLRLKAVSEAKKSLELEFFIYNLDEASRIFTQALIRKAQEGVKVRLLIDFSVPVFQLSHVYARFLKSKGIEVRYYNDATLFRLVTAQHRSHRKVLIADGLSATTGGRNIGNEYFDLNTKYNFLDTDLEVRGPLVATILNSFNLYWDSDFSREPDNWDTPLNEEEVRQAEDFLKPQAVDEQILEQVRTAGADMAAKTKIHTCHDILFVTDFPNQGEANRKVFAQIVKELNRAERTIVAESPYFVIKHGGYQALQSLHERKIQLEVLTNSLHSTDAFYTIAALVWRLNALANTEIVLKVFDGHPVPNQSSTYFSGEGSRWGVHSKRAVVDGHTTLIGTYNIDPRSANLNSEMMIVCRNNPEFAAEVLKDIRERTAQSRDAIAENETHILAVFKEASLQQVVQTILVLPLANLFDFLL